MADSIDAYDIAAFPLTKEQGADYVKFFKLKDVFEKIDEEADLDEFVLFFAIEDSSDNRKQLEMTFGRNWRDNFVRRLRLPDNKDDIKKAYTAVDSGAVYDSSRDVMAEDGIYFDETAYTTGAYDETMYKYFPKADWFRTLNNERAGIVISLGYDISVGYKEEDNWFKKILSVVFVVLVTWLFPPAGAYVAAGYFMAGVAIFLILTEIELPIVLQLVMSVVNIGAGFAKTITGELILQIANLAIKIAEVYEAKAIQKEVDKIKKEKEELDAKTDAINFGHQIKFMFGSGFYKSYMNDGVHKDPYQFLHDHYNPFRTYKNLSYNMWDQQD